jgi:restriction system protein
MVEGNPHRRSDLATRAGFGREDVCVDRRALGRQDGSVELNIDLPIWVVRAGEGGAYLEHFLRDQLVGVGWSDVGPIPETASDEKIRELVDRAYGDVKAGTRQAWASQIRRFVREPRQGDPVATYDRERRCYVLGAIRSGYLFAKDHPVSHQRQAEWLRQVSRDVLSAGTRNSLGSIATLFRLGPEVTRELWEKAVPLGASLPALVPTRAEKAAEENQAEVAIELHDYEERARQFIEDRIARLGWEDMQELVAGILRAMGYQTRVSEKGPDRGVDIFASPDGLGLQEPRIFVEVKHRQGQMGAQDLRAFLGGRKLGDRCLYVSTGGFTKEARYEAERASIPIRLLTAADLRELLLTHYEKLDAEVRTFVPLRRVYWPAE